MSDYFSPAFGEGGGYAEDPFAERSEGMYPPGMEHKLLSSLMAQERYGDMDKAKHNPHYMSYLLENGEGDMPW